MNEQADQRTWWQENSEWAHIEFKSNSNQIAFIAYKTQNEKQNRYQIRKN